jgi:integrase
MNVRYRVELSQAERDELTAMLSKGRRAARKLKRAQILLAADAGCERGIFYRKPIGKRATKKRQTPVPIPPRLLAHLRRWKGPEADRHLLYRVQRQAGRICEGRVQDGCRARRSAGQVTPHTLRHTAATWLMQRGVPSRCGKRPGSWACPRRSCRAPMATITPTICRAQQPLSAKKADTFRWSNPWST